MIICCLIQWPEEKIEWSFCRIDRCRNSSTSIIIKGSQAIAKYNGSIAMISNIRSSCPYRSSSRNQTCPGPCPRPAQVLVDQLRTGQLCGAAALRARQCCSALPFPWRATYQSPAGFLRSRRSSSKAAIKIYRHGNYVNYHLGIWLRYAPSILIGHRFDPVSITTQQQHVQIICMYNTKYST